MKAFYPMFVILAALLLTPLPAAAQKSWPGCPWGYAYDPMIHGDAPACLEDPTWTEEAVAGRPPGLAQTVAATGGVAGLAQPTDFTWPEEDGQGWPGCPWGYAYSRARYGHVPACFDPSMTGPDMVGKPAGRAKPAQVGTQPQTMQACLLGEGFGPQTCQRLLDRIE